MFLASLKPRSGSVPRSLIPQLLQRKACDSPLARDENPTAWPRSLRPHATLVAPPSVPRSVTANDDSPAAAGLNEVKPTVLTKAIAKLDFFANMIFLPFPCHDQVRKGRLQFVGSRPACPPALLGQ